MGKKEYILVGVLFLAGLLALPAVRDAYLVQSIYLAVCAGLGIQ